MSSEIELLDALTAIWSSVGIRRFGDGLWSVSLGALRDGRSNTGVVYADDRETAYICINGGMRQVASGYHSTRSAALADALDIAGRFDGILQAAAVPAGSDRGTEAR